MLAAEQFLWFSFFCFGFWVKGHHGKERSFIHHKFDWYNFNLLAFID